MWVDLLIKKSHFRNNAESLKNHLSQPKWSLAHLSIHENIHIHISSITGVYNWKARTTKSCENTIPNLLSKLSSTYS
jgi:hypothetical protein